MKLCKILLIVGLCLCTFKAYSEELNVSIDKKTITEADTIVLTIEYTGDDNQVPDLNDLKDNFNIVSNSTSRQFSYLNGQISQSKTWRLELSPKKIGKISIKPIKIGQLYSNYAEVEVKEVTNVAYVPDSKENSNSPYFQIEQAISPQSPYVQQQLTLTLTIYDSIGLQNASMHISEESLKDWIITPLLNQPIVRQDIINGKQMNVITFAFAAFPQRSGEITSPQISFEGYYLKSGVLSLPDFDDFISTGISFLENLSQKVPVRMRTKVEKLNVRPIPADATKKSYWLPLKDFKIEDKIDTTAIKVGEPFNREIMITAVGTQEKNLPLLTFPTLPDVKQYPEKPISKEKIINGDIVTNSSTNIVYIPVHAGTFSLPAIEIEWFNVTNNRFEKALLPSQNIVVLPSSDVAIKSPMQQEPSANVSKTVEKTSSTVTDSLYSKNNKIRKNYSFLDNVYVLYVLLFVLFLSLIKLLFFRKSKNPYTSLVISTLKKHDYPAAKTALINWAVCKYGRNDIKNLQMIADIAENPDFSEQICALNKILYSSSDTLFDNIKFIATFKKIDKIRKKVQKNKSVLPNLYE